MSMVKMEIKDRGVREHALRHLADMARGESHEQVLTSGITRQQVHKLRELPLGLLSPLADVADKALFLHIDGPQLDESMRRLRHQQEAHELLAYFIQHGAPLRMIRRVLRASKSMILQCRGAQSVPKRAGRLPLPKEQQRDAIHRSWHELSGPLPDHGRRYVGLHQLYPQLPLGVLCAVIEEFN